MSEKVKEYLRFGNIDAKGWFTMSSLYPPLDGWVRIQPAISNIKTVSGSINVYGVFIYSPTASQSVTVNVRVC